MWLPTPPRPLYTWGKSSCLSESESRLSLPPLSLLSLSLCYCLSRTATSFTHLYHLKGNSEAIAGPVDSSSLKITADLKAVSCVRVRVMEMVKVDSAQVLMVSADRKHLHVSRDGARSWTHYRLPASDFVPKFGLAISHIRSVLSLHTASGHVSCQLTCGYPHPPALPPSLPAALPVPKPWCLVEPH